MFYAVDHWIEVRLLALGASIEFCASTCNGAIASAENEIHTQSICIEDGETRVFQARFSSQLSRQAKVAFELCADGKVLGQLLCAVDPVCKAQIWSWDGAHSNIDICLERERDACLSILCVAEESDLFDTCGDTVALSVL